MSNERRDLKSCMRCKLYGDQLTGLALGKTVHHIIGCRKDNPRQTREWSIPRSRQRRRQYKQEQPELTWNSSRAGVSRHYDRNGLSEKIGHSKASCPESCSNLEWVDHDSKLCERSGRAKTSVALVGPTQSTSSSGSGTSYPEVLFY